MAKQTEKGKKAAALTLMNSAGTPRTRSTSRPVPSSSRTRRATLSFPTCRRPAKSNPRGSGAACGEEKERIRGNLTSMASVRTSSSKTRFVRATIRTSGGPSASAAGKREPSPRRARRRGPLARVWGRHKGTTRRRIRTCGGGRRWWRRLWGMALVSGGWQRQTREKERNHGMGNGAAAGGDGGRGNASRHS